MRRVTIFFLIVICAFLLTLSAFALTKEERAWKEDILTLLSLVKRVGDYSELVDLIDVAPALKEDPKIRKAFVTFAPPGATPPEWAREEKKAPAEVPKKIVTLPTPRLRQVGAEAARKAAEQQRARQKEKERREMKEKEARRIAQEVAAQKKIQKREVAPPEIIATLPTPRLRQAGAEAARKAAEQQRARQKEKERREMKEKEAERIAQEVSIQKKAAPPEIIAILPTPRLRQAGAEAPVWPPDGQKERERHEREKELKVKIKEKLEVRPTPLPKGAKVIYSTDVVSKVEAIEEEGRLRVVITLSGKRKYTVSERGRPPAIVIDIPHTINAVSPGIILVNRGGIRMIKTTQHRSLPFDETRIAIILNRWVEYEVRSSNNEIHIEFEE